jgi:glycolate oxidase
VRQRWRRQADVPSPGGEAARELRELFGEERVLMERVHLLTFSYDAFLDEALPSAIVFPHSAEEVASAVRVARRHGLPVVPRGRGTNLSGGTAPLGNALVIEFLQMDRILGLSTDDRVIQVEAGVYNAAVSAAAGPHGYFYAPDSASGKACSLGGNVAEGAGGPHCLKYGVTRNHVRWLRVVLPDGSTVRLGGQAPDLPGYDLVGLFIGSEGTLGICTEAGLELVPMPEAVRTMLAVFDSIEAAGDTVTAIIPATLEMMDNLVIQAVEDSLAAGFPRDAATVLLIELDGLREALAHESEAVERLCVERGARELRLAHSEAERELLSKGRKGPSGRSAGSLPTTSSPTGRCLARGSPRRWRGSPGSPRGTA